MIKYGVDDTELTKDTKKDKPKSLHPLGTQKQKPRPNEPRKPVEPQP